MRSKTENKKIKNYALFFKNIIYKHKNFSN